MLLEDLLALLLYSPLLIPALLLFIYAFGEHRAAKSPQLEVADADRLLAEKEHP